MKLVAITSCPTGIAHTYMAAESLEQAARAAGHTITVETQGAAGSSPLPADEIATADAVIFAADVEVRGRERFAGKPVVAGGVKRAINDPNGMLAEAAAAAAAGPTAASSAAVAGSNDPFGAHTGGAQLATKVDAGAGLGTRLRQWLMTGVSYMIPFVAAGGILIAIAFMLGGAEVATRVSGGEFQGVQYPGVTDASQLVQVAGVAGLLFKIGSTAFQMLVPILAGFIAFGMADRPGIAPGVVGGLLATYVGAGFLGGIVAGLLAGFVILLIKKVKVPRGMAGIMPVVVMPLVGSLIVGALIIVLIGEPIASGQNAMTEWLNSLAGTNAAWGVGALLGLMMGFDLGGPVNKVAYTFGLAALASGNLAVMAAVMAAGMVPPLGLALATVVRRSLFTKAERTAGEAAWLLGVSFITEGAIPFAAADPLRVIPSTMIGGAATGALSMLFGATSRAPHGGLWVIGLIGNPALYVVAIVIGMVVTAGCVIVAKMVGQGADSALVRDEPAVHQSVVTA